MSALNTTSRTRPNYFYAIISVALVLFLLGFFGLFILNAQQLITHFKENVNLLVELKEGNQKEEIDQLIKQLERSSFAKENSIKFYSKTDAANFMSEDFGEDFLKLDLPNPLYDIITFNVKAVYMQADSLKNIRNKIRTATIVNDVFYQESLVNDIAGNMRKVGYIALGTAIFFIIVAFTLIHNTIRLALYSNRFLIKNMQLVGASWEFISRPYLIRSIKHGLISGMLAVIILILLLLWIQKDLPELRSLFNLPAYIILFFGLAFAGIFINTLSTYLVVKKYLKMRLDDLY